MEDIDRVTTWDGRKDGLPSPRVPLIYINLPRLERRNLGGDAVPVRAYCGHHWRMARGYPVRATTLVKPATAPFHAPSRSFKAGKGATPTAMTLSLNQCHSLLLAERSRDAGVIEAAVNDVLTSNSETNLLEIEMAFRDAGSPVYLIAKPELTVVIGMPAWRSALDRLGTTPRENRYALAGAVNSDQS